MPKTPAAPRRRRRPWQLIAQDLIARLEPYQCGHWRFRPETLVLIYQPRGYEVDLERMTTSAAVLDSICQVAGKAWCSPEDLGHLVDMIDTLLHPQGALCSFGVERGPIRDPIVHVLLNLLQHQRDSEHAARRRADHVARCEKCRTGAFCFGPNLIEGLAVDGEADRREIESILYGTPAGPLDGIPTVPELTRPA